MSEPRETGLLDRPITRGVVVRNRRVDGDAMSIFGDAGAFCLDNEGVGSGASTTIDLRQPADWVLSDGSDTP